MSRMTKIYLTNSCPGFHSRGGDFSVGDFGPSAPSSLKPGSREVLPGGTTSPCVWLAWSVAGLIFPASASLPFRNNFSK